MLKMTLAALACFGAVGCSTVIIPVQLPDQNGARQVRTLPADQVSDLGFHSSINSQRQANGLPPLAPSGQLFQAARLHAVDMATRDYFDHVSPDGSRAADRAARQGVPACGIGENIAFGQKSSAAVFDAWMGSRGHRANILNPRMRSYGLAREGNIWVLVLYAPC